MMLQLLSAMLATFGVCNAGVFWSPIDCAFSVWSEWSLHQSGLFELRTREILREAAYGGQPCTGPRIQYRLPGGGAHPAGSEAFWGNLLVGNAPSYSLGGGQRYTLSRDIVLAQDSVVDAPVYPYYKSLISNILGKICGDFGSQPQDNRMHIITFDSSVHNTHTFSYDQERENFQDIVLRTDRSSDQNSDLKQALFSARQPLTTDGSGARRYNNATKEVLLVITYQQYCSGALLRSAEALKTTAEVFVIVVGGGHRSNPPSDWCMKDLASTPTRSHFLHLEDITAISEESRILLAQSPVNHFCQASGNTGGSNGGSNGGYN